MNNYREFYTWKQLLDAISAGYSIYYQAPMDYRPIQVSVVVREDGLLRVSPIYTDIRPFTVDNAHLSRFRQERLA